MESTIRVQLEALQGPIRGQRALALPGIPLIVGRATDVGLCVPDDPTVSRHHFQISVEPPDCVLKSLSSNGTWVNKTEVSEIVLVEGDEIRIGGDSVFRVRILHGTSEARPTVPKVQPSGGDRPIETYSGQNCPSGLVRYCGETEISTPPQIVKRLGGVTKIYALADFRRLDLKRGPTITADAALFPWLPDEVALDNSPIFIPATSPEFEALLTKGWGRDALVLFCSQAEPAALLGHLRRALKFNTHGKVSTTSGGFLGICWPAILDQVLTNGSAALVESFFQGIDAVLLESVDTPSPWQLLAPAAFSEVLQELGLAPDAATQAALKNRKSKK